MTHRYTSNSRGFTLAELMISITIFIICVGMSLGAFVACYKLYYFTNMLEFAHTDVRNASDKIAVLTRQSIWYPSVYTNTSAAYNPSLPLTPYFKTENYTNYSGTNALVGINYIRYGNELRLLPKGYITALNTTLVPNATTINVISSASSASISQFPLVKGIINSATLSSTSLAQGTPDYSSLRAGSDTFFIKSGNSVINAGITGIVSQTTSNTIYGLGSPLTGITQPIDAGVQVFVGTSARFIVISNELRYYSPAASSTYQVLADHVTSAEPFYVTCANATEMYGPLLSIDLTYTSRGDVTGKGIYRIITRAAMRTDPSYKNNNYIATGGVNGNADHDDD